MTDNYKRTKEWLKLAFPNIERTIKNVIEKDYPISVYFIQLSIEQLLKGLIFFSGLQFKKTHEPSKILEKIKSDKNYEISEDFLNKIKTIALLAKDIEAEGTLTRYGDIIEGKLIYPEERYGEKECKKYLNDLYEILRNIYEIFKNFKDFESECKIMINFLERIEKLI
ncbi:MAG: HEPN domain-containing protein [Promethearchaeota archaeon]